MDREEGDVHGKGGACVAKGGMCGKGGMHCERSMRGRGCAWQGGACVARGMCGRGACMAGEIVTAADGTHPTGMHSCCIYRYPC